VKLKNGGTDPAYLIGRFIGAVLSEPMREAVHKERIRALEAELAEARALARRFYNPDGTWCEYGDPKVVIEQRIKAARLIQSLAQERDAALAKLAEEVRQHDVCEEALEEARAEAEALRALLAKHHTGRGCHPCEQNMIAEARLTGGAPAPECDERCTGEVDCQEGRHDKDCPASKPAAENAPHQDCAETIFEARRQAKMHAVGYAEVRAEAALAREYAEACRDALMREGVIPQDFADWQAARGTENELVGERSGSGAEKPYGVGESGGSAMIIRAPPVPANSSAIPAAENASCEGVNESREELYLDYGRKPMHCPGCPSAPPKGA